MRVLPPALQPQLFQVVTPIHSKLTTPIVSSASTLLHKREYQYEEIIQENGRGSNYVPTLVTWWVDRQHMARARLGES